MASTLILLVGLVGCALPGMADGEIPESVRRRLPYVHTSNAGGKSLVMPMEKKWHPHVLRPREASNSTHISGALPSPRRRLKDFISGVTDIGGHKIATQEEGTDYYFATLMLGSPAKPFDLIIDTGSTLAYLPCEHTCTHCGHHEHDWLKRGSSTYEELDCHSKYCSSGVTRLSCTQKTCSYSKSYLEGSSVSGVLVQDMMELKGPNGEVNQAPVVFGCTKRETNLIYSQDADGVMGIGREPISIPSQLVDNGIIDDIFSMCMAERRDGRQDGHMVFGAGAAAGNGADGLLWVPMKKPGSGHTHRTSWYIVTMDSMSVGGKKLETSASSWSSSSYGGAVIDTGTTDMMLPRRLFDLFNNAIIDWLKSKGDFHHYYDRIEGNMCFKGTADTPWDTLFPDFSIAFGNGDSLELYAYNYVLDVNKSTRCLSVFTNSGGVILGSNTLLNVLLVFDRKNWQMGFAPSECNGPADYGNALEAKGRLLVESGEEERQNKPSNITFILLVTVLCLATLGFVIWYFGMRKKPAQTNVEPDLDSGEIELSVTRQERRSLINNSV